MPAQTNELVLVTGATGAIGPSLVHLLVRFGYSVRTLSRQEPGAGLLPANVEKLIGDVTDAHAVQSAMQEVSVVFHLAALLHVVDPPASMRAEYIRINLQGTQTIVDGAIRAGVKRLVFFSTIAVYGDGGGEILTEESPVRPASFYAETKLAAEKFVLNARRTDGEALGTVLRLGAVYGARIKGNYYRLLQSLARGRFVPIGAGNNRRTLICEDDVASAAVLVMRSHAAAGRLYNVSDGEFHTMKEIIATMCASLGREPPTIWFPVPFARFAAGVVGSAARLLGRRTSISGAAVDKYTEDIAVDSQRIQSELGFKAHVNLRTGWSNAIKEMRRTGEI